MLAFLRQLRGWVPMSLESIIGISTAHSNLIARIRQIAVFDAEVLMTGETGVGKEVYARLIHASSGRFQKPFVPVNCGGLPGDLFENELFGHNANAYTGARSDSDGLVAAAEGGTLFLDEVDSLAMSSQVKLLRFVQFHEYRRLGETRLRKSNARVIAATNQEISKAVLEGRFREDLFYRLRVIPIEVPPLRNRKDDIEAFVDAFSKSYSASYGVEPIILSRSARIALRDYAWPGNVRELENCMRYLTCLGLRRSIEPEDLPFASHESSSPQLTPALLALPLRQAKKQLIREFEQEYLKRALSENGGNVSRAARASGKNRRAFFELMRQHGLSELAKFERFRNKTAAAISEAPAAEPRKLLISDEFAKRGGRAHRTAQVRATGS